MSQQQHQTDDAGLLAAVLAEGAAPAPPPPPPAHQGNDGWGDEQPQAEGQQQETKPQPVAAAPAATIEPSTAASISVTSKLCWLKAREAYFAAEIVGMFTRIRLSGDKCIFGRIIDATNNVQEGPGLDGSGEEDDVFNKYTGSPGAKLYSWSPIVGDKRVAPRLFALHIKVDVLEGGSVWVPATNISSSAPLQTELNDYFGGVNNKPTPQPEEIALIKERLSSKILKRKLSDQDAKDILKLNSILKPKSNPAACVALNTAAQNADLFEKTIANHQGAPATFSGWKGEGEEEEQGEGEANLAAPATQFDGSQLNLGGAGGGGSATLLSASLGGGEEGGMSFRGSTQYFGGGGGNTNNNDSQLELQRSSTQLGHSSDEFQQVVIESNKNFQELAAHRTREQEDLVSLTQRNVDDNRNWILSGEHFERTQVRKFNLEEGVSLWEIDDDKRKQHCHDFDVREEEKNQKKKDDKKEEKKKIVPKTNPMDDPKFLLNHCLTLRKSQSGASLESQIPDSILEADPIANPPPPKSPNVLASPVGFSAAAAAGRKLGSIKSFSRPSLLARQGSANSLVSVSPLGGEAATSRTKRGRESEDNQ